MFSTGPNYGFIANELTQQLSSISAQRVAMSLAAFVRETVDCNCHIMSSIIHVLLSNVLNSKFLCNYNRGLLSNNQRR